MAPVKFIEPDSNGFWIFTLSLSTIISSFDLTIVLETT